MSKTGTFKEGPARDHYRDLITHDARQQNHHHQDQKQKKWLSSTSRVSWLTGLARGIGASIQLDQEKPTYSTVEGSRPWPDAAPCAGGGEGPSRQSAPKTKDCGRQKNTENREQGRNACQSAGRSRGHGGPSPFSAPEGGLGGSGQSRAARMTLRWGQVVPWMRCYCRGPQQRSLDLHVTSIDTVLLCCAGDL